jgi:hypothetical protein
MMKLLLPVLVLAAGSCGSSALRPGGNGGHGGNAASSGAAGGSSAAGGASGTGGLTSAGGASGTGGVSSAGGTSGTGGLTSAGGASGTGGLTGFGGAGGAGGATASPDAKLDGRLDGGTDVSGDAGLVTDATASSCENPLVLRCGDRLNHSTLVEGRANAWSMYACTQRLMSGREAIYVIQPPTACQVSVRLKNLSAALDLFLLQSCDFMSCNSLSDSTRTFAVEAGQSKFLVVDGYNGIAGSYALEVDCTCDQDGGTIDAPAADAPDNTGIAPGCDSSAAATAMSALSIATVGNPQMLSATLPTVLATDANWGLKATVCQQAGYDLTALAGKTVCLLEQDIVETCQGIPSSAWVVMSDGAVACVYKTVRQGFATAPGVYAANDASCTTPAIVSGTTVACEGRSCTDATGPCCPATMMMSRTAMCWSGCSVAMTCDGPEDCSNGTVCCSLESAVAGLAGTSCVSPTQCAAPSRIICRQASDCLASQKCGPPDPKPAFISTAPYAESTPWRVAYQVCAP